MFSLGKLLHMVTCILPCIAFKLSLKMFNTSISENEKKNTVNFMLGNVIKYLYFLEQNSFEKQPVGLNMNFY